MTGLFVADNGHI